jgi:hypothetical protein
MITMNYQAWLWHQLAEEARAAAKRIKDMNLRLQVMAIAVRYLVMAKRAEKAADSRGSRSTE